MLIILNFSCSQEQIQCDNNIVYRRAQKLESDANNSASNKIISTDKNCNATSSTPLDHLPIPKSINYFIINNRFLCNYNFY